MAEGKPAEYGSDVIVDLMKAYGIDYAAFNPGASFRGIHDSIVNYGGNHQPEVIECCHEEVSVAIAHGYAKAAGRPMVAILHNVVGLQHATMAIFNAWCDRVPILVLGGTGPMDLTRRRPWIDWVHTALVQGNQVRDYVKWDDQPHNLASVPESFIRGYRVAMTEPKGPVYLCYDAEIQEGHIMEQGAQAGQGTIPIPNLSRYAPPRPPAPDPGALEEAAQWLVEAEQPLIIADFVGRSPGAVPHLVELAELLAAPILDRGHSFNVPTTHPLDLTGAEAEMLAQADLVLGLDVKDLFGALGKVDKASRRFVYDIPSATRVIHITPADLAVSSWVADHQRLQAVDLPIAADSAVALPQLVEAVRRRLARRGGADPRRQGQLARLRARHEALRQSWRQKAQQTLGQSPIATAALAAQLWEVIKGKDWILVNGTLNGWARRLWDWTSPNQYLGGSGGAGLGYGLGGSIGAALFHRGSGRLCIDLQADGDLLCTPSALWTAAHHRLPLLVVMFNNRSYFNSEEHGEELARLRKRPVELAGIGTRIDEPPVNFAKLAQAFGLYGEGPIEDPREVCPALERALRVVEKEQTLALVDVVVQSR